MDFSDVCGQYLGRWAQILAVGSSLLTLLGGGIVYWILMSNFMYNVVTFIYRCPDAVDSGSNKSHANHSLGVYFLSSSSDHTHDATFDRVWDEYHTVPFFLVLVLGPLINFKSPTFFTKFNALGTISVCYLVSFVAYNTSQWGINLPFDNLYSNLADHVYIPDFRGTFVALTGIAALAYFVQNCVISICRNQRHPENNVRDLIIAYILVAVTYIYMGTMFYAAFPLNKDCIADNLLNNIADTNVFAFVARIGLFFQMMCVFPLLLYIFRVQLLHSLFGSVWPSLKHVLVLNAILVAICILFAVFLPHIGTIIGFVGAFCGFSYAILLPCLVYLKTKYLDGTITKPSIIFHSFLVLLGFGNFVGQFVLLGHKEDTIYK
ncbi:hypothetical protein FSP39_014787 [Pinctada imbricata]|uniref:Amino acid transporter transmembrane domain-containing protein n=1 Tax=Pinctada imbricata TaxID=66713 RepID=A0AA89BU14_PINIB|nr:hypothetical protein FSP39_014787 [Pinctada imbricata]